MCRRRLQLRTAEGTAANRLGQITWDHVRADLARRFALAGPSPRFEKGTAHPRLIDALSPKFYDGSTSAPTRVHWITELLAVAVLALMNGKRPWPINHSVVMSKYALNSVLDAGALYSVFGKGSGNQRWMAFGLPSVEINKPPMEMGWVVRITQCSLWTCTSLFAGVCAKKTLQLVWLLHEPLIVSS